MAGGNRNRAAQRLDPEMSVAQGWDRKACAQWNVHGSPPMLLDPDEGAIILRGIAAADGDPNTYPPAPARVFRGNRPGGVSFIALTVICDAEVVVQWWTNPWTKAAEKLTGDPQWVRVGGHVTYAVAGSPQEGAIVDANFREMYPQIVSGPASNHLAILLGSVA